MSKINENYRIITCASFEFYYSWLSYDSRFICVTACSNNSPTISTRRSPIKDEQFFDDINSVDPLLSLEFKRHYLNSIMKFSKVGSAADTTMRLMLGDIPILIAAKEASDILAALPATTFPAASPNRL